LAIYREVGDRSGEETALGNLGICLGELGQTVRAMEYLEQSGAISREVGDRLGEAADLGNLGLCYGDLGQTARAIKHHELALAITREVGNRRGEGITINNLGGCYSVLGQTARAAEYHGQALAVAREVGNRPEEAEALFRLAGLATTEGRHDDAIQHAMDAVRIGGETANPVIVSRGNETLAQARLAIQDLPGARGAAEAARAHDVPRSNHNVLALLGLIALRQGDCVAAAEAFSAAIAHAGVMLDRCEQNYNALDAKGLALAGLALLEGPQRAAEAIAAFRAARAITNAPGVIATVKGLLDALAPADKANILASVYEAAAGRDATEASDDQTRPSP
jgi:tetratricopeptide (TPR) repeat protein